MHRPLLIAAFAASASCASTSAEQCELAGEPVALPTALREASGLAMSRTHDDVLWTHNDSDGGEYIYAIDTQARLLGTVRLDGAQNRDWEDIAIASCPIGGPDGDCIYVADIGDNRASREGVGLWVLPEPDPRDGVARDVAFLRVRYPDGPRDAEALVVTPDHTLLIITKGRDHPVAVYRSQPLRWPTDSADDSGIVLDLFQRISDGPVDLPLQVTGASMAPAGDWLAIRGYAALQLYRIGPARLEPLLEVPVALDHLGEPQGEGIAVGENGTVFLSSEAGPQGIAPRLTTLRCRLP